MPFIRGIPGENLILSLQLNDGATDQYPQSVVYDSSGNIKTTVNLSHIANGNYQGTFSDSESPVYFTVVYTVYSDAGHTVVNSDYERVEDKIFIKHEASYTAPGFSGLTKREFEEIARSVWKNNLLEFIEPTMAGYHVLHSSKFDPFLDTVIVSHFPGIEKINEIESLKIMLENLLEQIKEIPDYIENFQGIIDKLKEIKLLSQNKDEEKYAIEILKTIGEFLRGFYRYSGNQYQLSNKNFSEGLETLKFSFENLMSLNQGEVSTGLNNIQELFVNLHNDGKLQITEESRQIQEKIERENPRLEILNSISKNFEQLEKIMDILDKISTKEQMRNIVNQLLDLKNDIHINAQLIRLLNQEEEKRSKNLNDSIDDNFFAFNKLSKVI